MLRLRNQKWIDPAGMSSPWLGGGLRSGTMRAHSVGVKAACWGWVNQRQVGAGLKWNPLLGPRPAQAASSSSPSCSVSLRGRCPASLRWQGCVGGRGEQQFLSHFSRLLPLPSPTVLSLYPQHTDLRAVGGLQPSLYTPFWAGDVLLSLASSHIFSCYCFYWKYVVFRN